MSAATLAESVRNSRQAVINGDYATANVFYNVAIKSCNNSPELAKLKENLVFEQNALTELAAQTISFANSFEKQQQQQQKPQSQSQKQIKKQGKKKGRCFFLNFFFFNGYI
jgi:hypothetical protein